MPRREVWDVEPHPEGWAVKHEGSSRATSVHARQDAAIARATELARKAEGQVRIKGRDGKIRGERTYGNDPYPPLG